MHPSIRQSAPTTRYRPYHRFVATGLCFCSLALLIVSAELHPNPNGSGTHEQLGLPPCGFKTATGLPCATCGMTTAFSYAAHGRIVDAFIVQPAGAVLAVTCAMLALVTGYAAVRNTSLDLWWQLVRHPYTVTTGIFVILTAWAYTLAVTVLETPS